MTTTADKWSVTIDELEDGLWSVRADRKNGDHQGTTLAGSEQDARSFAHEQYGKRVKLVVNLARS